MKRIHLRTSLRCNNNCVFCMERSPELDEARRIQAESEGAFLTPEGLESQLAAADLSLPALFTSGEPTLNPDLSALVALARRRGVEHIVVQSNARRLSYPGYALELVRAGVTEFSVSIHGSAARVHDAMTRTPGGFAQSWQGLAALLAIKRRFPALEVGVTITVTRINLGDLRALLRALFALPGLDHVNLNPLILQGNGARFAAHLQVRHSDILRELDEFDREQSDRRPECRDRPGLSGIPPCVGRGAERPFERVVLFEPGVSSPRLLPEGRDIAWARPADCGACALAERCGGVQPGYLEAFGSGEFRA